MNTRKITTLLAGCFLLVLLQLVAGLVNPIVAAVGGCLVALLAFGIFRFFEVEFESQWVVPAVAVGSSLAGAGIVYFFASSSGRDDTLGFAPLAAALTAGAIIGIGRMSSRRCGLCNRRIGGGVAFDCPRCGLLVCERDCWVFEQCRCRLCEQNRVPVFSPDGRWWDRHFGPRSQHGRCQICQSTAEATDLRVCGKCGRPQCRDCWDYANGQCSRCHWIVDDLPEPLRPFMGASPQPEGSRHH
jgi:hypothetical protein